MEQDGMIEPSYQRNQDKRLPPAASPQGKRVLMSYRGNLCELAHIENAGSIRVFMVSCYELDPSDSAAMIAQIGHSLAK